MGLDFNNPALNEVQCGERVNSVGDGQMVHSLHKKNRL